MAEFQGKKLKGCYAIVNIKPETYNIKDFYDKKKVWLMLKSNKCD